MTETKEKYIKIINEKIPAITVVDMASWPLEKLQAVASNLVPEISNDLREQRKEERKNIIDSAYGRHENQVTPEAETETDAADDQKEATGVRAIIDNAYSKNVRN